MFTLIISIAAIGFIHFISTNVSREYKVLKFDKPTQKSYRKRERLLLKRSF